MSQNLQGRGLDVRKRMRGETEIAVEVAGNRSSWIAVALHSDFRSQVHFVEFLRQSVLGVFQRYRRKAEMPTVRRFFRNWMKRGCNDDVVVSLWYP
jgi:hypothetical protein